MASSTAPVPSQLQTESRTNEAFPELTPAQLSRAAIQANKSLSVPGALNRFMNRVVPASIVRTMEAKLLKK